MKLKIRYEEEFQTIELDAEAMKGLWVSLSLEEDESLTEKERERRLQKAVDETLNRPEYNNFHRHQRHIGYSGYLSSDGEAVEDADVRIRHAVDPAAFYTDEDKWLERQEYEDLCRWIRESLPGKPEWAEAFIAVCLDGESIREYAARTGASENNVTQKLKRAKKKLKKSWQNRQI